MIDPTAIIAKLPSRFENARNTGDLLFFSSTVVTHIDSEIEVIVIFVQSCPKTDITTQENGANVFDPFAPPYNVNLHVGDLKDEETQEEFVVLLNKFSIVPQHFLLVTKEFKSQASPLLPSELVQTYLLLSAARKSGKKFLAFYNCGDNSGASQPHKHIQFIPLDNEDGPPIDRLAKQAHIEQPEKPFSLHQLSYASHSYRFPSYFDTYPSDRLEMIISDVFLQLIDLTISTIRHHPDYPVGSPSYNVIITLEYMHIIPRRQDSHVLKETGEKVNINALGFAGMLLAKSEQEVDVLKREGISKILRGVGLEILHDIQAGCA